MELIGINGLVVGGAILLAGAAVGFLLGRRTSAARARARQLEEDLEELQTEQERNRAEIQARKEEQERARAEIQAGKEEQERNRAEIQARREELEGYRAKVADHFAGTSERLRDLTLQYRAVYSHLAEGAGELCPEGFEKLDGGLGLDALPEESDAPDPDADPDPYESA